MSLTCGSGFGSGSGSWAVADWLGARGGEESRSLCSEVRLRSDSKKGRELSLVLCLPESMLCLHVLLPLFCALCVRGQISRIHQDLESSGRAGLRGAVAGGLARGSWEWRRRAAREAPLLRDHHRKPHLSSLSQDQPGPEGRFSNEVPALPTPSPENSAG